MAPRADTVADDWMCKLCWGTTPKTADANYVNFGSRKACNSCGQRKGDCFLSKVAKSPGGKGNGKGGKPPNAQPSLAQANKELQAALARVAELEALSGKPADSPDEPKLADNESAELQEKVKRLEPMVSAGKLLKPSDAGYEHRLTYEEDLRATRQKLLELKPPGARLAAAKGNLKKKETAWDKTKASRHACEKAVEHAQAELEQAMAVEATAADAVAVAKQEVDIAQEAHSPAAPPAGTAAEQQTLLPLQARFDALLRDGAGDAGFAQSMRQALLSPATPQPAVHSLAESADDSEEEMDEEDDIEDMLDRMAEPGETEDRRAQRRQDLEKADKAKKEKAVAKGKAGKVAKAQLKAK